MIRKHHLLVIVFMFLVGCATAPDQGTNDSEISPASSTGSEIAITESSGNLNVNIIGGDEESYQEFISRWFSPMNSSSDDVTTILFGELPADIPFGFPLPEHTSVFASVQTPYDIQILLDTPVLSDALTAYAEQLEESGWMPIPENGQGGGFVADSGNWQVYCDEGLTFALIVQTGTHQQTGIRISYYAKDTQYMCDPQSGQQVDQAYTMMPTLETPADSMILGGGTSSGGGTAESSSEIRSKLSAKELNAWFSSQLEKDAWQHLNGGDSDHFSWGSWVKTDDQDDLWYGTLIVLEHPTDDDLAYALLKITKSTD